MINFWKKKSLKIENLIIKTRFFHIFLVLQWMNKNKNRIKFILGIEINK